MRMASRVDRALLEQPVQPQPPPPTAANSVSRRYDHVSCANPDDSENNFCSGAHERSVLLAAVHDTTS